MELVNTHIESIIIYAGRNTLFATFLIRSYMVDLSEELFDSAKMNGANNFQTFFYLLPNRYHGLFF